MDADRKKAEVHRYIVYNVFLADSNVLRCPGRSSRTRAQTSTTALASHLQFFTHLITN